MKPSEEGLPPHSPDAEMGLLGSILVDPDPRDGVLDALESIGPDGEAFYEIRNRVVFRELVRRTRENLPTDLILLQSALKDQGVLERAGGLAYLSSLPDKTPSTLALATYVAEVREKYMQRRLIKTCLEGSVSAQDRNCDPEAVAARIEVELSNLDASHRSESMSTGLTLVDILMGDLERRHALEGRLSGIASPWFKLDEKTEGFQAGDQTIIGARPSMGKTAIGLQIAHHAAFVLKIPTIIFSLEMSKAALLRRLLAMHSHVDMNTIRKGSYSEATFKTLTGFASILRKAPLVIVDAVGGMNSDRLAAIYKRACRKYGIKVGVVDYLQKIKPSQRHEKRTYEISAVSGSLKALAVQTETTMVTMAQLNREPDKGDSRPPRLSDLADSSQIERDADTVLLLHRDKSDDSGKSALIIGKQRDGELGTISLTFNGRFCKFDSASNFTVD